MAGFGDKPFGLRDIKLTNAAGTTQVDLPSAMKMTFRERLTSGEMRGDDVTKSVVAITDALEWELEAGGISLEAYALMSGRTVSSAGTTPNRTVTLTGVAGDNYPYFKIYGKSVGDIGTDDIHVLILKAKLTSPIEGEFSDTNFFVTKCGGVAIDNGTKIFDIVQNETAATLPTS